jgi:hypothetical protein
LIATYQDLGLIKDNVLTIISPKQRVKQFELHLKTDQKVAQFFKFITINFNKEENRSSEETISYYQSASDM